MSRTNLPLLLVLCFALLASCGRSAYQYTDNDDVEIVDIRHFKDGDFLVVQAALRNDSASDIQTPVYRVEWYDARDRLLETSAWRPLIVKGGVTQRITERSTVPGAVEYTLILSTDAR